MTTSFNIKTNMMAALL